MKYRIEYLPEAEEDIIASKRFLDRQSPGLGDRFVAMIEAQIARIAQNPLIYGTVHDDVRGLNTPTFTHVIYYLVIEDAIKILAVQHGHRDTSNWLGRV